MFSSRGTLVVLSLFVLVLGGCGKNNDNIVNFWPRSIALEKWYEHQYVETDDMGNAAEKVLAFRQAEEKEDTTNILDTIMIVKLAQYVESPSEFKTSFSKNYQSLIWFDKREDKQISIWCKKQKAEVLQFSYSDNPLDESFLYVTQLYLSDANQRQSYMLSHVTQHKKTAKGLIKKMKGIACKETWEE